jgi:hypothetical protein
MKAVEEEVLAIQKKRDEEAQTQVSSIQAKIKELRQRMNTKI